jgi:hypothetical protein
VFFVPIFFVVVRRRFQDSARQQAIHAAQATALGVPVADETARPGGMA